jgi:hemoglobin/transferrin/lactoferrin receptor protein
MLRCASFHALLLAGIAILPALATLAVAQDTEAPLTEEAPQDNAAAPEVVVLDTITVVPTKTEEDLARSLAAVSHVGQADLQRLQPTQTSEVFFGMPGVAAQSDSRRSQTSINIRGLQDFGRVAVIVDGARNNFQRSDHGTQSVFWIEPELLKEVTVVRGPVSNIYGSGAIGGVVVFETIDSFDFLRDGEYAAGAVTTRFETNGPGITTSATAATRIADVFGVIGNITYKNLGDYTNGKGDVERGTATEILGGMLKATVRPDENQELEFGWIGRHDEWTERFGNIAARDTVLEQNTFTGKYEYRDPGNEWVDLHVSGYLNDTDQDQEQITAEQQIGPNGQPVNLPAGTRRGIHLQTVGVDGWNTSRFETAALDHAVTYGGDWFRDEVDSEDPAGGGDVYTPSGERQAYGAFIQDQLHYSDWLEIIAGLRFDGYSLEGEANGVSADTDGTHLSPRLTVGVLPFERTALNGLQVYGTYAQGYRSPAITETLIGGLHPYGVAFPFLPNPDLKPEIATTYEIGLNFARDDLFIEGDALRVRTAVFRNDIEDYINMELLFFGAAPNCPFVPGPFFPFFCAQYQNVAEARIDGFEFESLYDAGTFFGGFNVTLLDGEDRQTGDLLLSVPPATVTGRLGARFFDRRVTLGGEVQHVFDKHGVDAPFGEDYTLVNLFASYEANENVRFDLRISNLFDETYSNYLNAISLTQPLYEPGFNAKIGATIRFGAS